MVWKCAACGVEHDELPICFGIDAPWRALVDEKDFESRVELNEDLCVIDYKTFFVRGHVEIPILEHSESFAFSVWSSLSERSFVQMNQRWNAKDRAEDAPYFGWLSSPIHVYPNTIHLKLSVQPRSPGLTPLFLVKDSDHQLAVDQRNGISIARWHQLALKLMS
jgi:hypothetical protein